MDGKNNGGSTDLPKSTAVFAEPIELLGPPEQPTVWYTPVQVSP